MKDKLKLVVRKICRLANIRKEPFEKKSKIVSTGYEGPPLILDDGSVFTGKHIAETSPWFTRD